MRSLGEQIIPIRVWKPLPNICVLKTMKEVDCEIPHWLKRETRHSFIRGGHLSLTDHFENCETVDNT